ncbi:MAG: hypothetical protein KC431_17025, partial [Myxococcales bacterium]|nr:hypothetical protein [Myxococcales bacterium]
IMNYAELISESEAADEMIREFAAEIDIETKRVATIVRNLLAFSRQELSEAKEPYDVRSIIEGTLTLVRAVLRKDQIEVSVDIPPELPEVLCRRQQIQQVLMNLVTNARDALNGRYAGFHPDKRVEIRAEVFSEFSEPWVRIIVSDHAGGIPAEVVGRIFDPFFTTKGRDQGTGLGLAMSHGIVADHGGRLELDNRIGDGASFAIELPCLGTAEPATREPGLSGVWTIAGGL